MRTKMLFLSVAGPALTAALLSTSHALEPPPGIVEVTGHIARPEARTPSLERLQVAEGFQLSVFGDNLTNPRMIAVADNGDVYVTLQAAGEIVLLRDTNGDGRADIRRTVAMRPDVHGIAVDGDTVFFTTVKDVYRAQRRADGSLGEPERIIDDLPDGGQHPNRTLAVGSDGDLFISVGSSCNACEETNPEHATMLKAKPDGSSRRIYASGLRNTVGFAFQPETGRLYGLDMGIDWLGDDIPHEELNLIVDGGRYGWPYLYDDGQANPRLEWAAMSENPLGLYTAHASPLQIVFYSGDALPQDYRGDAFVTMRGSWNRNPPSGYEIVRIAFENGEPQRFETFVSGFVEETGDGFAHYGRLAGIAQTPDGALLFADDENGIIYRATASSDAPMVASGPSPSQSSEGRVLGGDPPSGVAQPQRDTQMAAELFQSQTDQQLQVQVAGIGDGQPLPARYGAEQENISPSIR